MFQRPVIPNAKSTDGLLPAILVAVLLAFCGVRSARASDTPSAAADAIGFQKVVTPFVKTHCVRCHGPAKQEGNFRVDQHLKNEFVDWPNPK